MDEHGLIRPGISDNLYFTLVIINIKLAAPPRDYHGIYIHIGEESYFKVGRNLQIKLPPLERRRMEALSLPYINALSLPSMRCTLPLFPPIHGDCLTTAEAGRCRSNLLRAKRALRGFRYRGLSRPKFGQQNEDGASVPADIRLTSTYDCRELFLRSPTQVFPERPVNIGTIGKVSPSKSQFAETM